MSSPKRIFWRYAIPSVTAMIVSGLYQIIDGVFVGHYIGATGLAAINLAWPILFILCGIGILLGMGIGSAVSHCRGEENIAEAKKALGNGLLLSLLLGVIGTVFLFALQTKALEWQGATGDLLVYGKDYLSYFGLYGILTVLGTALPMLIRNDDRPYLATITLILGAVFNIILDYLFIGVLQWGLGGAAIATLCSQGIISAVALIYFFSHHSQLRLTLKDLRWCTQLSQKSLALGSSCLVMYLYTSFVVALHNLLFLEYGNADNISAFAIVGYLMSLYYLFAQGIAEGMQPPVSFYHGAKENKKLFAVFKLALNITLVSGVIWTLLLNAFPTTFIHFFNNEKIVTSMATEGIRWHLFAMTFDGLIALSTVYFMSIHQAQKALWISLANMIVQLPFLYVLPKLFGVLGIWLAMPVSNLFVMGFVCYLFWQYTKQIKQTHIIKPKLSSSTQ